jgi:3-deoxy-D-manno-octulosonic-acid transferase
MRFLYSALYATAAAVLLPRELLKRPRGARREWLAEKLGRLEPRPLDDRSPLLWLHAVSVGEVVAASYFIQAFRVRYPEWRIAVSTVTDTGRRVARERLSSSGCRVVYLPFDLRGCLRRAIRALRPSLVVVMETEIWPGLLGVLREDGIPAVMMNGRISERSFRGYMRARRFFRGVLADVSLFLMQSGQYADRIVRLGADAGRVMVTGNMKFDLHLGEAEAGWTARLGERVIVAGSTHPGEEELIARVYKGLRARQAGLALVIAPRHPERATEVAALVRREGLEPLMRSAIGDEEGESLAGRVVILDTVGELAAVYRACTVAVIGGSFVPHGGQNPLEPAYWGKPVVCGPHMGNFPFFGELVAEGAALSAEREGLEATLGSLLESPRMRDEVGSRARAFLDRNRGAVLRSLDALAQVLGEMSNERA